MGRGGAALTLGILAATGLSPAGPVLPNAEARSDSLVVDSGLLGRSGNLRFLLAHPARTLDGALRQLVPAGLAGRPGVHPLVATAPDGDSVVLVTLLPFDRKTGDRLGEYRIGSWPAERAVASPTAGTPKRARPLPAGFIEVTPASRGIRVSKLFRFEDFLTHDQRAIWPKYLLLDPRLVDKLELIGQRLAQSGRSNSLRVMSGFRTPQYNALGVGPRGGRARDSRHMYGDAADVYVDADGNGVMDDLDGDGRVTIADGRYLLGVAEAVEREHPELVGGLSAYRANRVHGPFLHVDARGVRARW